METIRRLSGKLMGHKEPKEGTAAQQVHDVPTRSAVETLGTAHETDMGKPAMKPVATGHPSASPTSPASRLSPRAQEIRRRVAEEMAEGPRLL
eukprot:scaffold4.g4952.t1